MAESWTLHEVARRLAEGHRLRWNDAFQYHLGLHRGVCYRIAVWDGELIIQCSSPSVSLVDQILNDFAGADCLRAGGIPPAWLSGGMSEADRTGAVDCGSLVVELNDQRLETLGVERSQGLLDLLSQQFAEWGAEECVSCSTCQQPGATEVAVVNDAWSPLCDSCWESFRARWPTGRAVVQRSEWPIWKWVWILVAILVGAFVLLLVGVQLYVAFA